jgi:hypothetical protein
MKIRRFKLRKREKPYIRKVCDLGRYDVWTVDSEFVRKNICEDFVNMGHHYNFKFIPKNEFWICKETNPGEQRYYIEFLLIENRLRKKGASKTEAFKIASKAEKKERKRSSIMERIKRSIPLWDNEKLVKKVHKHLLKVYSNHLKIWVIKGELVRDLFDIDFAGGTHDKVDCFVPDNEVWLDDDISQKERKFILLHELHERFYMAQGMHYHPAHLRATKLEDYCRHHPEKLNAALKKELKKNHSLEK